MPYLCSDKSEKMMKRETVGIIVAVLVLAFAGGIGWHLRDNPQKQMLRAAEDVVFTDADSAARLLAQVDTTRLTAGSRMLYGLMRALVHEEQCYLEKADTASCLSSGEVWSFNRKAASEYHKKADEKSPSAENSLQHIYDYYEHAGLGGTTDDKDALRRFGRICLVLSRHQVEKANEDRLLHLAIHCAETGMDHALAYRAYHLLSQRSTDVMQLMCMTRALEHFRSCPDHTCCLLTLLNDYGRSVLLNGPFDLCHFSSLVNCSNLIARQKDNQSAPTVCDSVYQCLDSLWALPAPNHTYMFASRYEDNATVQTSVISVPTDMYEEFKDSSDTKKYSPDFKTVWQKMLSTFKASQDTYLAAGYVMKAAALGRSLLTAVIIILVLTLLLLMIIFRNWRMRVKQRHATEREAHQRVAEQLAERLRQKDALIAMLRGHIMDKNEILDMLEPTAGKRTVINARNWREIEMTLDTADGNFVSRLRAEHPQFSEEDIRLCMLARLQLSNTALSAIYLISVSAVQHRKQKLKKEGFGVTEPSVTFDQIIANF